MHVSDRKVWSQDPPLPRPYLRVDSGGEGISLANPAYLRPSKGKQIFFFCLFVCLFLCPWLLLQWGLFSFAAALDCAILLLLLYFPSYYSPISLQKGNSGLIALYLAVRMSLVHCHCSMRYAVCIFRPDVPGSLVMILRWQEDYSFLLFLWLYLVLMVVEVIFGTRFKINRIVLERNQVFLSLLCKGVLKASTAL